MPDNFIQTSLCVEKDEVDVKERGYELNIYNIYMHRKRIQMSMFKMMKNVDEIKLWNEI